MPGSFLWVFRFCFHKELIIGAVGMWESRSDFQGRWERRETWFWFSSFSTARHFHGAPRFHALWRFWRKLRNNFRLATCMRCAASVSLCAFAIWSRAGMLTVGFR